MFPGGLLLILDPDGFPGLELSKTAERALAAGARAVQLRSKRFSRRALYAEALEIRKLTRLRGAVFLVNDYVDLALAVEADGVHLGQSDLPLSVARRLIGPGDILGASARTPEEALAAAREGANYLGVGAIYPTTSKAEARVVGLEGLRAVRDAVELPIMAIGGITPERVPDVIEAGADGVAVLSAVLGAPRLEEAVERFLAAIRMAEQSRSKTRS
ncbi:MAG: thiamine phosphate synthase [Nitrospirae bacterium]|nr:thiamine phosphate synthase [Nitrospirota bacterium]